MAQNNNPKTPPASIKDKKKKRLMRNRSLWETVVNQFHKEPVPHYGKETMTHMWNIEKMGTRLPIDKGVKRLRRLKELDPHASNDLLELAQLLSLRLPEAEDTGFDNKVDPQFVVQQLLELAKDLRKGREISFGKEVPIQSRLVKLHGMELDRLCLQLTNLIAQHQIFPEWYAKRVTQLVLQELVPPTS